MIELDITRIISLARSRISALDISISRVCAMDSVVWDAARGEFVDPNAKGSLSARPTWVPDAEALECKACLSAFSMWLRRVRSCISLPRSLVCSLDRIAISGKLAIVEKLMEHKLTIACDSLSRVGGGI